MAQFKVQIFLENGNKVSEFTVSNYLAIWEPNDFQFHAFAGSNSQEQYEHAKKIWDKAYTKKERTKVCANPKNPSSPPEFRKNSSTS